jgi:large subunit ribosomal protein L30
MARKLRITQVRSSAKVTKDVLGTLHALGLRKREHTVEKADTPQIRGMIQKIVHLLKVEEVNA